MPAGKVIDTDHGWQRIKRDISKLNGHQVKIGLWGSEMAEGVSVVDYAVYNEFGTSRIPARPFMAHTYDTQKVQVNKFIDFNVGLMEDGKSTPDRVLRVLGEDYQERVRKVIRDAKNWAEPNAASTVAAKGSSSPLIDHGRMINAVRYEVS
jgi:hypothetical protein